MPLMPGVWKPPARKCPSDKDEVNRVRVFFLT